MERWRRLRSAAREEATCFGPSMGRYQPSPCRRQRRPNRRPPSRPLCRRRSSSQFGYRWMRRGSRLPKARTTLTTRFDSPGGDRLAPEPSRGISCRRIARTSAPTARSRAPCSGRWPSGPAQARPGKAMFPNLSLRSLIRFWQIKQNFSKS